jgi:hypothetical protein
MSDPIIYQIVVPELYEEDVVQSVQEVAASGTEDGGFTLTTSDSRVTSEMQFDPFTIGTALWIGKLIVEGVAPVVIEDVTRKLLEKMRQRKKASVATIEPPATVIVVLPDTNEVELDANDPNVEAKIAALATPTP